MASTPVIPAVKMSYNFNHHQNDSDGDMQKLTDERSNSNIALDKRYSIRNSGLLENPHYEGKDGKLGSV